MIVKEDLDSLNSFINQTQRELNLPISSGADLKIYLQHDISVEFPSNLTKLELIRRLSKKIISLSGAFSELEINDIALAIDEACTNIIRHSYKNEEGKIILRIKTSHDKAIIEIKDFGKHGSSFNPLVQPGFDKNIFLRNYSKSGFGLFLIKKIMDRISYYVSPGESNKLIMEKYSGGLTDFHGK